MPDTDILIVGQGLAGSTVAWRLHLSGRRVLLVDRGEQITASKIAAGLITPVTGRRLVPTHRYQEIYRQCVDFYRRIEKETDCSLLDEKPAIRLFQRDEERSIFDQKLRPYHGRFPSLEDDTGNLTGFEMRDAARLDVARFLERTRQYFTTLGQYQQLELDLHSDIVIGKDGTAVPRLGLRDSFVVLCQGYQDKMNSWFPMVPDGPSKGEILRVHLPNYHQAAIVHKGMWLVPDKLVDGRISFLVGATYDRDTLNNAPTIDGRDGLLTGLQQITAETPTVIDHVAAVRAGTRRRKPVVGQHPVFNCLFILNGLGSHGALLAPVAAQALGNLICGIPINKDLRNVIDFLPGTSRTPEVVIRSRSLTQMAHNVVRRIVLQGDTVIDATAGNGHDTQLLAVLVGSAGRTIAIDIQQSAIDATTTRLAKVGLAVDLRRGDHASELESLKSSGLVAKAIMFNLGYLPGSDKQITTTGVSTLAAVQFATEMVLPGGVITIIAYRGHVGGFEEATTVEQLINTLPDDSYETSRIGGNPDDAKSPVLFVVRRISRDNP